MEDSESWKSSSSAQQEKENEIQSKLRRSSSLENKKRGNKTVKFNFELEDLEKDSFGIQSNPIISYIT